MESERKSRKGIGFGVSMIVIKEKSQEVLMGKRRGIESGGSCVHGGGEWNFPGGKMNYYENSLERGLLELYEETGLTTDNIDFIDYKPKILVESSFSDGITFKTLYLRVKYLSGEIKIREPLECEEWRWYKWEKLPNNLFLPIRNLINKGYSPFKEVK